MTVDEVRRRVLWIAGLIDDDATAHWEQDKLYVDVLQAIVAGAPDAPALAAEALHVEEIEFSRWYS